MKLLSHERRGINTVKKVLEGKDQYPNLVNFTLVILEDGEELVNVC